MSQLNYRVAVLSEHEASYRQLQSLLLSAKTMTFSVTWVEVTAAITLEDLPSYDVYFSDAPLLFLVDHQGLIREQAWFWVATMETVRQEILHLGVMDCFLWEELSTSLLEHCVRLVLRDGRSLQGQPSALTVWEGDRLQTLMSNIPGVVYRCLPNSEWHGVYFSDAIEQLVGYPAAEFAAGGDRQFVDLIHPADRDFVEQVIRGKIQEKKPYTLEYRVMHRDGTVKWVDERGQGVFDTEGNLLWLDGVIVDISEKKAIAKELHRQAVNYYEKTPAMLHAIDLDGNLIAVSDRWLAVMGYERKEVLGHQCLDFLTEASRQYFTTHIFPRFLQQGFLEEIELQFIKKNGEHLDVLLSAIAETTGGFTRNLAVLTDVTARNQLARELDRYQQRLHSLVNQTTQALTESEARLRTLFDVAPLGIAEVDLSGYFRFANQRFVDMLGLTLEELLIKTVLEITEDTDVTTSSNFLLELRQGLRDRISCDKRYRRGDSWFWGHLEVTTVRNRQGEPEYFIAVVEDIHTRKLTEESLRQSERRLVQAQAIAHIGSWEWDLLTNHFSWSAELYRIFDLEPDSLPPTLKQFMAMVHPGDRPRIEASIATIKQGKPLYDVEYQIITATGQTKTVLSYVDPVTDATGAISKCVGALQDITAFKQTVLALRASEARFVKAQRLARMGSWEWDAHANKTTWSDEVYRIFERPVGSVQPNYEVFMSHVHPEDQPKVAAEIQAILAHQPIQKTEYRAITAQGNIRHILEHCDVIRDEAGQITHITGSIQDITSLREATLALEASEARLARSEAIAHVGNWEWVLATNTIIWSDELFRIFGFEPQTFEPSYDFFLTMLVPEDLPVIESAVDSLRQGKDIERFEYRITSRQGQLKILRTQACITRNAQNEVIVLNGITQDISDFKQTLMSLQASETRLAQSQAIAKVGSWDFDPQTQELIWSEGKYRIFELDPQTVTPTYALFLEMIAPGDRPRVKAICDALLIGIIPEPFDYRIITPQGQEKIIREYVDLITNSQGEVIRLSGTVQDITDFQQAIAALQESETRFRELVEHIDESFWVNPADPTSVSYASPAYERIWGRTPASLIADGSSWIKSIHPDHQEQVMQAMVAMAQGTDFNEEYRIIRPDGTIRWVHARSAKIFAEDGTLLRHVGVVADITQRKQVELELRASEARFRSIFDQAALGIAQIAITGEFYAVNQAFCDLVGYSQVELSLMKWQDVTHPEDLPLCIPGFEQLVSNQVSSFTIEKRYVHKQGHIIWIKAIASFLYDENNQPEYLLAFVEDITTFKAAQTALAISQNRYQELVEGIPAIVYQYSLKQGGIFYSSQLKAILGYAPAEMLAQPKLWHDSIHPDDQSRVDTVLQNLKVGKNFEVEYRIHDAAGNWLWFYDCSFSIHKTDDDLIIDGFALDITQRKYFDTALRHRLSLETTLAEISHLMIAEQELDLTAVLKLLGRTFQADRMSVMMAQPEAGVVNRLAAWAATPELTLDPKLMQIDLRPYPWWLWHWQTQRPILINRDRPLPESAQVEREFLAELKIQAVMWRPIPDHQGQPWGYIECSSTDPNHFAWSEEDADLLAIAGDLIYNYWERQRARHQLEAAKEAAEAANHAKNQFLTNMSHELRTPLNAVLGFTQLMEQSPHLPENHREHLAIVRRSGKHLLTLLNDILNLAKFEKGTLTINPTLFNLHALLDDLENMYRLEVQRKQLQFEVYRDDPVPRYITADQAKLHSVLIHLLSNALKFTDSGFVQLRVELISPHPLQLRFSVIDTGIGIQETDQPRLFDNFVKLEAGDRLGQGSGLGLALSQKLVNLMGSEIVVSSQLGDGSCFSFELTCGDTFGSLPLANHAQSYSHNNHLPLAATDLLELPPLWRKTFHQAALAARAKQLEQLIQELPTHQTAIATALQNLLNKLEFDTLAALSKPTNLDTTNHEAIALDP